MIVNCNSNGPHKRFQGSQGLESQSKLSRKSLKSMRTTLSSKMKVKNSITQFFKTKSISKSNSDPI